MLCWGKVLKDNFPSTVLFIAASQGLQQQLSNCERHNLQAASMEWNKNHGILQSSTLWGWVTSLVLWASQPDRHLYLVIKLRVVPSGA